MNAESHVCRTGWRRRATIVRTSPAADVLQWVNEAHDANRIWARNTLAAFLGLLAAWLLVLKLAALLGYFSPGA